MITRLYVWLQTVRDEERGATAVEYGLLAALIAAFIVGAVTLLGTEVRDTFNDIASKI
jgi:pilus assembly protein Flp/PilA